MKLTGLTLGGFIQHSIARNLLEQPANVEKGLCHIFIAVPFDDLEYVNRFFSIYRYAYYVINVHTMD